MNPRILMLLAFLLPSLAVATQSGPVYTDTGTPAGACLNSPRVRVTPTGTMYCCIASTWTACGTAPAGSSGNLQTNNGAGGFGAYGGTSCAYAMKTLSSSGAATCTSAPTIPADVSGAHYVTTQAEAGLSAEAVLPTCTGTQKLTFNGATISCAADADTLPPSLPLSGPNGGLGLAQPTCAGTDKITCNGTTCSCAADIGGSFNGTLGAGIDLSLWSAAATSVQKQKDSPAVVWWAAYWDPLGPASQPFSWNAWVDVTSDAGASTWRLREGSTTKFTVDDAGVGTLAGLSLTTPLAQASGGTGAGALTCAAGQHLTSNGTAYSCSADSGPAVVHLTADFASSAVANTLTTITGLTSPTLTGEFRGECHLSTTRAATTNGPRYGVVVSTSLTANTFSFNAQRGLTAVTNAPPDNIIVLATAGCAAGCTAAQTSGTLAQILPDVLSVAGKLASPGTVSIQIAPSAGAANTVRAGSTCIWY